MAAASLKPAYFKSKIQFAAFLAPPAQIKNSDV